MFHHDPDWLALFCGIVFVVLGVAYVVASVLAIHIKAVWALPALLVALGGAGLIGTGSRGRRRDG